MLRRFFQQISKRRSLGVALAASVLASTFLPELASGAESPVNKPGVQVFASADDSSAVIEQSPAGDTLSPIAEMTGAGGMKWFMVRTKSGNVGWIKSGSSVDANKIDQHFRSLPKESEFIAPGVGLAASTPTAPATGAITVPVKILGPRVLVPVSFQSGSSTAKAYLVLDTGAMQTMISKRMARDLRLLSVDSQVRTGISGSLIANVGVVDIVSVGRASLAKMPVTIHDLPTGSEGLLGFDFLGRFQMSIDTDRQEMLLSPRK